MFKFLNSSLEDVTLSRRHRHNDEPAVTITVPSGSPFEASSTVYDYDVPAGTRSVGDGKDLVMVYGNGEAAQKATDDAAALTKAEADAAAALKAAENEGLPASTPAV